jgi:tRNA(fMet)-specific endonuclease VapC
VAPFDEQTTVAYGVLRATLEKQGTPIGPLDTMIAAHALSLGVVLVTNNTREFNRVAGLKVTDWVAPE